MNKTFPTPRPPSGDPAPATPTLTTLAAALVSCRHPPPRLVPAHAVTPAEASRIRAWCPACGAIASDPSPNNAAWTSAALPSRLTKKHFEELALLLHAVRQLSLLAQAHPLPAAPGSPGHAPWRNLRASLSALARLPLVRDIDRLEEALAQMPSAAATAAP